MRTCIVSGGTGGLGRVVTTTLLAAGWRVVVPWVTADELSSLPESDPLVTVEADLFDEACVRSLVADVATAEQDSPLTAVVNLVGGFAMGPRVESTPIEEFDRMLTLNLRPTYLLTQSALPAIVASGGGSVVAISAHSAFAPFSGAAPYLTAKAALWTLIESISVEYRNDSVRANALLPSVIDTPANRAAQPDADRSGWADPVDVASVVSFLISDAARAVTGARIPVTGIG